MRGYNDDDPGLIPLSIRQVFDCISDDKDRKYDINVSYLEVRDFAYIVSEKFFKWLYIGY
jgi:hypothetical protein